MRGSARLVADRTANILLRAPLRRRARAWRSYAAAAGFAALAISAGIFIGMSFEQSRAVAAAAPAPARDDAVWPPADLTMWPTDSVSFKIPAEYSPQGTLVAVDPDSKHGSTRYWIDVVVSNDGTFRIERIVPADSDAEAGRTRWRRAASSVSARPCCTGWRLAAAQAHADDAAAVPDCPPSPAAAARSPRLTMCGWSLASPYSALGISQTVTTLPDGNRIVRQNTIRLWRDSDGRTRSEFSLSSIGGPDGRSRSTPPSPSSTIRRRASATCCSPTDKVAVTMPIAPCRVSAGLEPDLVGRPAAARRPADEVSPRR